MSEGFLGRWSRRKLDARDGKPALPDEKATREQAARPAPAAPPAAARSVPGAASAAAPGAPSDPAALAGRDDAPTPTVPAPLPTLDDVHALTPQSDFRPFVQRAVDPQVRNAAMKRLFSDPHFNVMDMMDVYVDDYSQPDPLPLAVIRQMAGARVLGLADEDVPQRAAQPDAAPTESPQGMLARDDADDPGTASVAQSPSTPTEAAAPLPDDADPDLRLQQDDAAGPQGPGAGAR